MSMHELVYVGPCEFGRGVFASRPFESGDVILRFSGTLLCLEEAVAKTNESMNPLQIAPRLYVDLDPPGVYLNHSCEPNAGVRDSIFLIALRPIARNEEIRFDYSTTMDEDLETMDCRCGMASCRRVIGDFIDLPRHTRDRYLSLGIVQPFIRTSGVIRVPT